MERTQLARNDIECYIEDIDPKRKDKPHGQNSNRKNEALEREFNWTAETALRLMQVADVVGKNNKLLDLDIGVSTLYQLAAPSTPPEAVETVIDRAKAGEKVTGADVKRVVDDAKSKTGLSPPSDAFKRAEKMRKAKLKKDKADEAVPEKVEAEGHDQDGVLIEALNDLIDKYGCDKVVWMLVGQCGDLALVVKVLIDGHGFDAVSDEVLEHNT